MFNKAASPDRRNASTLANKRASIKDIARIAEKNGFRTSAVARSLATSRTATIGVVVTSISDPFVAEVVNGIEEEAIAQNYSVFLASCHADSERELKVVHSFEERRVDGIVVTASRVGALYASLLGQMQIPIVLLNNQHPSQYAHSVLIENFEASRAAVSHLLQLGHERIAYIGDRLGYGSDSERFSGYRSALDEAGIPFRPDFVVHGDGKAEGGSAAMQTLLMAASLPTAVFCYNDMTAIGALKTIRSHQLNVPGDISLVGFDDLPLALYMDPPLTTVRQPKHEMGRLAMQVLLKLMAGIDSEQNVRVSGELVIRESTAPPKEKTECNYSYAPKTERTQKHTVFNS